MAREDKVSRNNQSEDADEERWSHGRCHPAAEAAICIRPQAKP